MQAVVKKEKQKSIFGLLSILLSALYFTSYVTRINFSAVMADMIQNEVLTKSQAGLVGSALFFTYGFGQILSGLLGDKLSANKIICAGLITTTLCNFLMPICTSPTLMVVIWGVNGLAQAFFWPPIVKLMATHLNSEQYSKCALYVSIAMNAATILIYAVVPVFTAYLNWKAAFFVSSAWAALFFFVWIFGYREVERRRVHKEIEKYEPSQNEQEEKKDYKLSRLFIISGCIFIFISIVCQGFLRDGIQSWLPTFFTDVFNMSSSSAIFSNILIPIFNVGITYLAIYLYNRVFKNEVKAALVYFVLVTILCTVLSIFYNSSAAVCLVIAALITGLLHAINSMLISFLPRRFVFCGKVSSISGIANAFTYVGSTVSSYGIAAIAENMGWQASLISWAIIAFLGVLVCLFAINKWTKFIKEH
ncbi:MAG: MFS transporter [Ruminococcaceae bacterium]|nr:MFS transporter [Oscillospiraceae bacterium]